MCVSLCVWWGWGWGQGSALDRCWSYCSERKPTVPPLYMPFLMFERSNYYLLVREEADSSVIVDLCMPPADKT
jgi:hypothetical protein